MNRLLTIISSLVILFVILACGGPAVPTATLRQPMLAGQVDQNMVETNNSNVENEYALPSGTLRDSASLTTFTNGEACFSVTMAVAQPSSEILIDSFQYELIVDDDIRVVAPRMTHIRSNSAAFSGRQPVQIEDGYTQECAERNDNGECDRWEHRPNYINTYQPASIDVTTATGDVCFYAQAFTPQTGSLRLHVMSPEKTATFAWSLGS